MGDETKPLPSDLRLATEAAGKRYGCALPPDPRHDAFVLGWLACRDRSSVALRMPPLMTIVIPPARKPRRG